MGRSTSAAPLIALATAALLAASPAAHAQGAPVPVRPARAAVATNPLAIPFGLFTLDVEAALPSPGLTAGVGGTWLSGDEDMGWADARVMYFPGEIPLKGFAIGLTAGLVHEQGDRGSNVCLGGECAPERSETAPTLGVRLDYDWLVGARKRMLVGIGLGAKRMLRDRKPGSPLDEAYGEGRFVIGLTF